MYDEEGNEREESDGTKSSRDSDELGGEGFMRRRRRGTGHNNGGDVGG